MKNYFLEQYNIDSTLIAYGGDNASHVVLRQETKDKFGIDDGAYAFKVCRIEPENNIEMVLSAFSRTSTRLIIVGNWSNSNFGASMRGKYSSAQNISMLDAIYDQEKLDELRSNCGIYVHGHSVGGTNPSLVEAMNLGLCCLAFDVDYNRETTENKADYFKSMESLEELIQMFDKNKLDAYESQKFMLEIAKRRYTWEHVVSQYENSFNIRDLKNS